MRVYLSPTLMDTYRKCPRCAYDQMVMRLKQPRGAFPTLPNGLDNVVKSYLDQHRGGLPPELSYLDGRVIHPDQTLVNTYRQWNGLKTIKNISVAAPTDRMPERKITHTLIVNGGIDDLLYIPGEDMIELIDIKSKATEPDDDYGDRYYQFTMDTYAWMLKEQGFQVSTTAWLFYWWPHEVKEFGDITFKTKLLKMTVNADNAEARLQEIAEALPAIGMEGMAKRPAPGAECEYCTFVNAREELQSAG